MREGLEEGGVRGVKSKGSRWRVTPRPRRRAYSIHIAYDGQKPTRVKVPPRTVPFNEVLLASGIHYRATDESHGRLNRRADSEEKYFIKTPLFTSTCVPEGCSEIGSIAGRLAAWAQGSVGAEHAAAA
jgi:hypothetical protein